MRHVTPRGSGAHGKRKIRTPFSILLLILVTPSLHAKCVQIYYDRAPGGGAYPFGLKHAVFARNLVGHFPGVTPQLLPVDEYRAGALDRCEATLYFGTHYDSEIPEAFLKDFRSTKSNVLWAGYGIWNLGERTLASIWGAKFAGLAQSRSDVTDDKGEPGFYRYIRYRGEEFIKYGAWSDSRPRQYLAATEMALLKMNPGHNKNVLAWATHSATGEKAPYAIRSANRWYFADSPFAFMTEEDRYLIFADVLFDVLGEAPRHPKKKPALIRLEDVHPMVPPWQIRMAADTFHGLKVPFSISLIPLFVDPLGVMSEDELERDLPITASREFVEALEYARARGASFILHGYTHQLGKRKNPWNGLTGDDFEFWDRTHNRPVAQDSVPWVMDRLEDAMSLVDQANRRYKAKIRPVAWLTPHYQGSALDCTLFGQLWEWTVGRNIYFTHERSGLRESLPAFLRLDRQNAFARKERYEVLRHLAVRATAGEEPAGQFFPYEIFGDIYGQRVIPENVGNIQPYMNEQVHATQSPDDLIRILRRNRVLRDAWGSWFVHPFRLLEKSQEGVGEFPGDTREIARVVKAALGLGYEFIDLQTWEKRE